MADPVRSDDPRKEGTNSNPDEAVLIKAGLMIDPMTVSASLERFIRDQVESFQREGAILGMSGGIDSAVVANLAVRALGPERVHALLLPERDSNPASKTDAMLEIERLGISHREIELAPMLKPLGVYELIPLRILGARGIKAAVVRSQHSLQAKALGEMPFRAGLLGTRDLGEKKAIIEAGNAYARVKHRMRMLTLYYHADMKNLLVLGTTNKSESMSGFVVKWGDNVADIEPILPLYKTQVRQLARHLGVSERIISKPPSPDLIPGIDDEMALGMEYRLLDEILWGMEQGWSEERIAAASQASLEQVRHAREMWRRSAHLRAMPPAPELP